MQLTNWLASWWIRGQRTDRGTRRTNLSWPGRGHVPTAESLESRLLPAIITVTSLADTVVNDGQVTLREAIQAANYDSVVDGSTRGSGADTIQFAAALTASGPGKITLGGTELVITSDLTLVGPGADRLAIDGNATSRIFRVDDGNHWTTARTVEINGLTMTNGRSAGSAGGIDNWEKLTLRQCTVSQNLAAGGVGGGIVNQQIYGGGVGGELTVDQCSIVDNTGGVGGGSGGGIGNYRGSLTILRSTVSGNVGGAGGGIASYYGIGTLTIANSTISGNSATGSGGGIKAVGPSSGSQAIVITQSTISGNVSARSGGGIDAYTFASLDISQCTIVGNTVGNGQSGGGVRTVIPNSTTLTNTIVAGNKLANGTADDLGSGGTLSSGSRNNLIGDPAHAGGLINGANGNIVGNGSGGVRSLATVLDPALADIGGRVKIHALISGSPAINAGANGAIPLDASDLDGNGNTTEALPFDERGTGFLRVVNGSVDIGAHESQTSGATVPIVTVGASQGTAMEDGSGNLVFWLSRDRTSGPLVVNFSLSGTAGSTEYTANASGTVTFADGASTVTVTVDPTSDSVSETDETVVLSANSGTGYLVELNRKATGTILNDDGAVWIAATSAANLEGNSGSMPFTFTVTRTSDASVPASVNYSVSASGANGASPSDFGGSFPSGTVSFVAGETQKTITINVSGDSTLESEETFTVTLSNATGVAIGTASASGTIRNDDESFAVTGYFSGGTEGNRSNTPFRFTVNRTGYTTGSSSVNYAVAGSGSDPANAVDFGGVFPSGTVSFAAGQTELSLYIIVTADSTFEATENFTVTLSRTSGTTIGGSPAWGAIRNDDLAPVSNSASTATYVVDTLVDESDGNFATGDLSLREAIERANSTVGTQTITFAAALTESAPATITLGGTQLAITSDLIIDGPGANRLTIDADRRSRIFKIDDGVSTTRKNVVIRGLTLAKATDVGSSGYTGGAIGNYETLTVALCTIRDSSAAGGGGVSSLGGDLTVVQSTLTGNTATDRGGAIHVDNGGTLTIVQSTINGNSANWYGGGVFVQSSGCLIDQSTIFDNLCPNAGAGLFAVNNETVVNQSSIVSNRGRGLYTSGGMKLFVNNSILVGNNANGHVDFEPDTRSEWTVANSLIATFRYAGLTSGVNGNIIGQVVGSVVSTTLTDLGGPTLVLPLLSGSSAIDAGSNGSISADPWDSDGDGDTSESQPFDQRGSGFARVFGSRVDMGAVEFGSSFSAVSTPTGSASIAGTNASRIEGNGGTVGFTFTVTRTDSTGTASVNYTVTGSGTNAANAADFGGTLPSGTVSFAAGESSKTITVNVSGDTTVETNESFTVTLSSPVGVNLGTASAAGTIRNEDSAVSIVATSADQSEGNDGTTPFTFTVTRTGAVSGSASVDYAVTGSGTNAADADDFGGLLASGTVSFAATETSKVITLNVSGDTHIESDDEFVVTLSNVIGVGLGTSTASGVIRDDDGVPPVSMLSIATASASVSEGNSGTTSLTFTVSRTIASGSASVDYAVSGRGTTAAEATDFGGSFLSGTVHFASGETTATVVVDISGDALIERDEDFVVTLSNPVGATLEIASADGTINNDDGVGSELANVLLDVSGNLHIRDLVTGGRVDRLLVSFDSVSQEFVIRDSQNTLAASVGTVVDSHEIRVAQSAVTGSRLIVDLNDGADQLDLSALPVSLLAVEVNGGAGNDTIVGHAGADSINGGAGNDSISTGAGNDTLLGGDGNDVLNGEAGNDSLCGQMNNDRLLGGDGDDTGDGGGGDDNVSGDAGNDSLLGSTGNDLLNGGDGRDKLLGGDGRDSLNGNSGHDQLLGGLGNDALDGGAGDDYLEGQAGNDALNGSVGNDTLNGNQDADTLIGLSGDDRLDGGDGNDVAKGGEGNDTLLGGLGDDNLSGSIGNDVEEGGGGADTVAGGDGNDSLSGGDGHDYVHGDAGQDELQGNAGDDSLHGGTQNDVLFGDAGNDILVGGENDDVLWGGSDNDSLIGQSGTDQLNGESGTDTLTGGSGAGADVTDVFHDSTDDVFQELGLVIADWISRV